MGNLCSCFKRKNNQSLKGESEKFKSAVKILKREKYKYKRKIGMGTFGGVIEVRPLDKQKFKFAAKIILSTDCSHVELKLWRTFQHDNVLPLLDIIQESDINIFLMPLHRLTMMEAMVEDKFIKDTESFNVTKIWITGVPRGLIYLHARSICHADLKVNNILITDRQAAVICDFSFSCQTYGNITQYGLPWFFRPPEAFYRDGLLDPVNGENFDLWSFGMLALYTWTRVYSAEMILSIEHWQKLAYPAIFDCLQLQKFNRLVKEFFPKAVITPEEMSQALNLLQGVLQYEAEKRPRASVILLHPLLNKEARMENLLEVSWIWTCENFLLLNDLEKARNNRDEWFAGTENEPSIEDITNFDNFKSNSPENRKNKLEENRFKLSPEITDGKVPVTMEDFEDHSKDSLNSKNIQDYQRSNAEVTNENLSSKGNVTDTSDFCYSHLQYLGYSLLYELCMVL